MFEQYLFDQQFSHPGWSGMIATIESNPSSLLDAKTITFEELVKFELLLEIDALDKKFNSNWSPLGLKVRPEEFNLFENVRYNELFDVLSLWQQAFEWSFYDQVLSNVQHVKENDSREVPTFQGLFCMDDRECSFRRHIEHFDNSAATFGTPAFFNFEFYFQPVNGKFHTKLCPAPVTPKYLIKEEYRKKKQATDLHYHKQSHSLFFGWIISQTLGFSAAFKLFLNIFKPSMSPATTASFKHLHKKSKLIIENFDIDKNVNMGDDISFNKELDVSMNYDINFFQVGKVPFLVIILSLLVGFSTLGYGVHFLTKNIFDIYLSNYVVVPIATAGSVISTILIAKLLTNVFKVEETYAVNKDVLIGIKGVVLPGMMTNENQVQVKIKNEHGERMIRSGTCMMIGSLFLTLSLTTLASTPPAFDPRDPAIWEEKSDNPLAQSDSPCEVFTSSVCPGWEDDKSDIQRERERREQQRLQNEYERRWRRD